MDERINHRDDIAKVQEDNGPGVETVTMRDPMYDKDFVEITTDSTGKRYLSVHEYTTDAETQHKTVILDEDMIVWLIQELLK